MRCAVPLVEHSAVNRELQITELVSLASVSSSGIHPQTPFSCPHDVPNIASVLPPHGIRQIGFKDYFRIADNPFGIMHS